MMGMGLHEWPLALFTVLGQCIVGGFLVMTLALLNGNTSAQQKTALYRAMFVLWVLMGIAFVASVFHLGSPWRAFNALNRIGASALSNEIAGGALFFTVGGLGWLLAVSGKMPAGLEKIWLIVTSLLGVLFVWLMTRVYQIDTVPTWYNGYTTLNFFLTVLIGGLIFGMLLLRMGRIDTSVYRLLAIICTIALIVGIISAVMQGNTLEGIRSSVQQASRLVPSYDMLIVVRAVLLIAGLQFWLIPLLKGKNANIGGLAAGFLLVFAGEFIARTVFYGLHMTVGVTYIS